jgi:hypothetical protein
VAAPGRLSSGERKKKGKGRGEADRRGRHVSGSRKNKKGTAGLGRCGRELVGRQAEGRKGFSFFSNSFQNKLFLSNSNQNSFKLFTKFYNPFRSYTSNQKPCKPNDDAQPLVFSILI